MDYNDEAFSIGNLMRIFNRMYLLYIRREIDKIGLNELSNPDILFIIRKVSAPEGLTQKAISDMMGVAPPTVATSLKRMERAGLIEKVIDKEDTRKNRVMLTEKGKRFTDMARDSAKKTHEQITKGFTEEEKALMTKFYRTMIENMIDMGIRLPEQFKRSDADD